MKIHKLTEAIHVDKEEGTSVDYFLFQEYEIHYNEVKPGVTQLWHHHPKINETLHIRLSIQAIRLRSLQFTGLFQMEKTKVK